MQKYLTIILILSLYSCGGDDSTNPQTIDHYSEDLQFLNELSISNDKSVEDFSDFIDNVLFDSSEFDMITKFSSVSNYLYLDSFLARYRLVLTSPCPLG